MADDASVDYTSLTADVVSAFVSNNKIHSEELATLIGSTYEALKSTGQPVPSEPESPKPDKAAIKKSQHPDHLTSFVDGRKYKSLKRHLSSQGMTPAEYRTRYGLPSDYPMVAANYSAMRSEMARSLGLGHKAQGSAPAAEDRTQPASAKRRGRGKAVAPKDETVT